MRRLVCTILLLSLVAMGGAPAAFAGKANDTLTFTFDEELVTADQYFDTSRAGVVVAGLIYDTLIYRDPKTFDYKPLLAASYTFLDNKTIDFELRKGVKFHNGEEFDADDVVYTLNWVSDPKNGVKTQRAVNWIERAEKLGKYKVRLIMKRPFPAALEYLAGPLPIYPKDYYSKVGSPVMGVKPVGTGPYKVVEMEPGSKTVFVKNQEYFKGSPKGQPSIGKIVFRTIPEQNTRIVELMSGGVDWIWRVNIDQADKLAKMPKIQMVSCQTMRIWYLQFDACNRAKKNPPTTKLKVRQAICYAIDRPTLVKTLVKGGSKLVNAACFPTQFGCTNDVKKYNYDPAKAKALLKEAGYPNGFEIEIYTLSRYQQVVEGIAGYLKAVGIKASPNILTYTALREKIRAGVIPIDVLTWGSYSLNDVSASTSNFFKGSGDDTARDPEVIKWLEIADTSVDPEVRKANYKKALQRIAEQAYWFPLWSYSTNYAFTKDLDFTPTEDEIPHFFNAKWK